MRVVAVADDRKATNSDVWPMVAVAGTAPVVAKTLAVAGRQTAVPVAETAMAAAKAS